MMQPSPQQPRRLSQAALALYVVAGLLAVNLVVMLAKDGAPTILPAAWGQAGRQPPIAGGAGLFVMPAQLSRDTYGAYLMDVDRGTLCVYQFLPGKRSLEFVAARRFTHDTRLENFNTTPPPAEIADLVTKQEQGPRNVPEPPPPGGP